ncbi:hypothetical protein RND81_07G038300 [Saponaria officinalis]|uniref:Uncharacterized protein n=1 Tax=Saponaria officinalis TaxID=3572 RepID=A0AAW1JM33_SAPOF
MRTNYSSSPSPFTSPLHHTITKREIMEEDPTYNAQLKFRNPKTSNKEGKQSILVIISHRGDTQIRDESGQQEDIKTRKPKREEKTIVRINEHEFEENPNVLSKNIHVIIIQWLSSPLLIVIEVLSNKLLQPGLQVRGRLIPHNKRITTE